jgi:hypothetical protein
MTNKYILYKDDGIKLLMLAIDIDPIVIGEKDVPTGKNFLIVDESELPNNSPIETWEIDDSLLISGVGLSKNEFKAKYPQYSNWAVIE